MLRPRLTLSGLRRLEVTATVRPPPPLELHTTACSAAIPPPPRRPATDVNQGTKG